MVVTLCGSSGMRCVTYIRYDSRPVLERHRIGSQGRATGSCGNRHATPRCPAPAALAALSLAALLGHTPSNCLDLQCDCVIAAPQPEMICRSDIDSISFLSIYCRCRYQLDCFAKICNRKGRFDRVIFWGHTAVDSTSDIA